jgi:hypothetical protein
MIETIFFKDNKNVDRFQKIESVANDLAAALR